MTKRPTSDDYEALADSYELEPPRADEILSIEVRGATLPMGRPAAGRESTGKTPPMTVRLPASLRAILTERVEAGEANSESELIRTALVEYFERHGHLHDAM